MGCCSLKKQKREYSKIEKGLRLTFFIFLHGFFLILTYLRSIFNKNYKNIHTFYNTFYKKARKEIREDHP